MQATVIRNIKASAAEAALVAKRCTLSSNLESGQGAVEYAVIAGLVLVVAATLGMAFSNEMADTFQWGIDQLDTIQTSNHTVTHG